MSLSGFPWLHSALIHPFLKWLTAMLPALEMEDLVTQPAGSIGPGAHELSVTQVMQVFHKLTHS